VAALRFFFPDVEDMPVPPGHRFPAEKYRLLRETIVRDAILPESCLTPSPAATIEQLTRAHSRDYVAAVLDGTLSSEIVRRIGLPWSPALAHRSRATVGGSLAAAREALRHGLSGQLAGGTHHAHRDFGSGFLRLQ